ncbi:MAG: HNH endonuclease [Verrucomicrobia bacterium]|nr:HNH endonuclease [Verrucomicrobiota bacterium]
MNPLERSLIEKAGYANGWENVRESTPERVALFSARHKAEAIIMPPPAQGGPWQVIFPNGPPATELARSLPDMQRPDGGFEAHGEAALGKLLRRAAELAMSLPNHAAEIYAEEIAKIEAQPPAATEALRLVKQRIGQNLFRQALMDYWAGACAVTGLDLPEALRASHAKPWAQCDTEAERLDVFNGFLLTAHLDALFDQGLMTFADDGTAILSKRLTVAQTTLLCLTGGQPVNLRWVSPAHLPYLAWHRVNIFQPCVDQTTPYIQPIP